jgi:hypothetical protein
MKRIGMLLAVLLALAGATPAASVRHLEYAFAVSPNALPNNGYYNGTMSVDILSIAPDGDMLIRASEWWYYTLRPRQAVECEVHANGDVRCDQVPPYPSDSMLVLLPLLAQNFFSAGQPANPSSWQQKFAVSLSKGAFQTSVTMDLSAIPQNGGRLLIVKSKGDVRQLDRRQLHVLQEGEFVYDRTTSTPLVVHDVRGHLPAKSVFAQTSVELRLTKDSDPTDASMLPPPGKVRFQVPGSPSVVSKPLSSSPHPQRGY